MSRNPRMSLSEFITNTYSTTFLRLLITCICLVLEMLRHLFSFAALVALFASAVAQQTPCPSPSPCDPNRCNIGNVCYVVDQSDSISAEEYQREQSFVTAFAENAQQRSASPPSSSLVAFSAEAELVQAPTKDLSQFKAAVQSDRMFYESSAISAGLKMCQEQLKCAQGNKAIVLVTDGQTSPAEVQLTKTVVDDIKGAGIKLVTAGIGCDVNENFLKEIATSAELYINLNTENAAQSTQNAVEKICERVDCPTVTCPPEVNECQKAFDNCAFTFAGKNGLATFDATGRPDKSFTSMVVSKDPNMRLGVLNMNDVVPEFIDDNGAKRITMFGSQRFTETHFKPYSIEGTRGSGIGHQTYHGNQKQLARNKCIRVFFSHVQLLDPTTNLNEVPDNYCVVFRTH
eukprot:TRINITY_DN55555_c0_g1_i1.p1 TRINITY_DN55555_c0_g1~~TRINITY_DN55555_c0_g1_i1.p1  ORF type:complete len:402 (+),score=57.92 TRINITY_DN55555_c0_g1_i1:679-1884(+)